MTDDNQTPLSSPLDNLDALTSATEAAAQDLVSQAAAEMDKVEVEEEKKVEEAPKVEEVPEVKAPEVPISPKLSVGVTEHPISDEDAAKFVGGSGDFAMPVSPLDDLSGLTPKVDTVPVAEPMPVPRAETPSAALPKLEEKKTDVIRPLETKDLEQKAKDMLNDLGPVAPKPKKKNSAVTRMALAAVLVVLMGVGGVVGVRYMNQSQENRSQAKCWPDGNGGTTCGDDEAYESARRTWADNDERSQVHDAEDKAEQQSKCGAASGCKCGTYVNDSGCAVCHEDCAAVAKSNQAMCGRDDCSKPEATSYNYSGDYACPSDSYGCNWGCCKTGSGEAYVPIKSYVGSTLTTTWVKLDKANSDQMNVLNTMLEQRGLKVDNAGNFTTVMNTAVALGMNVKRDICAAYITGYNGEKVCAAGYVTSWADYCKYDSSTGKFGNTNCSIVEGGYLSVSGKSTDGDICTPDILGGFDACTIPGNNGTKVAVSCSEYGFSRCNCGSGTWVVGAGAQDCNALCGGTGNCQAEICGATNPNPTPTPNPNPSEFACTSLKSGEEVKIGSPVSFTCAGSGGAVSAQFQYSIDGGTPVSIPTSTANKLKSDEMTFTKAGSYKVACRVCKADGTTCSDWGIAQ